MNIIIAITDLDIVFSIFVAFILEAFMLEYSFTHGGKFEAAFEKKIAEKGVGVGE